MALKEGKIVRVQERGQVTLPADLRRRLGLKKGDFVAFVETEGGYLLSRRVSDAMKALDQLGEIIRTDDMTVEEWIESGREVRGGLLKKYYGIDSSAPRP
jgi:AbrB family looped-hinge helix DNA binding protein